MKTYLDLLAEKHAAFASYQPRGDVPYLGSFPVTAALLQEFSRQVINQYDAFLRGKRLPLDAQNDVEATVKEYADHLMGRSGKYEIPPWLDTRNLRRVRYSYRIPWDVDIGIGLMRFLAVQCTECCKSLVLDGMGDQEAGERLGEILHDAAEHYLDIVPLLVYPP